MPYLHKEAKARIVAGGAPETSGHLNFMLTTIVHRYIADRGVSYDVINQAIGALECAKLELYRMLAAPYEDMKIKENGQLASLPPFDERS